MRCGGGEAVSSRALRVEEARDGLDIESVGGTLSNMVFSYSAENG